MTDQFITEKVRKKDNLNPWQQVRKKYVFKKPTPKTASNIEKLSKNSYDIAFKEFEKSLGGSSEQDSIKAKWAAAIIKQMNMKTLNLI